MGDYANEGIDKVALAPRHGERDGEDHRPRDGQGADIADGARNASSNVTRLSSRKRRALPLTCSITTTSVERPVLSLVATVTSSPNRR
jgi:hypothetical protein